MVTLLTGPSYHCARARLAVAADRGGRPGKLADLAVVPAVLARYQLDDDLANYDQVVWNTTQRRWFVSTPIEQADHWFGDHFAASIALCVPLDALWPPPSWMVAAQTAALAAGELLIPAFAWTAPPLTTFGGQFDLVAAQGEAGRLRLVWRARHRQPAQ